jgi:hypothetical protein
LADNGGPTQTIALEPDSPAIGGGDSAVCANMPVNGIDQRGFVRPGVGHTQCSIGAYEADAVPSTPTATPTNTPTAPPTDTPTAASCTGDCNGDGIVVITELILGVDIVLTGQSADACPAFADANGIVDIAQLIEGVRNALNGCGIG